MSWVTDKFQVGDEVEVLHGEREITSGWWGSQGVVTRVTDFNVGIVWHTGYGKQWHREVGLSRADHSSSAKGITVMQTSIVILFRY